MVTLVGLASSASNMMYDHQSAHNIEHRTEHVQAGPGVAGTNLWSTVAVIAAAL
jgi:hypothetical protein